MRENKVYKEFGGRLRRARKNAKLTQENLAERVGLTRTSITNIEKGRQKVLIHTLFNLASAVGVNPHILLPDEQYETEGLSRILNREKLGEEQREYVTKLVKSVISEGAKNEKN